MARPTHSSKLSPEGRIYLQYLEGRGISQGQFAREIGVSDSYLSRWANDVGGMTTRKIVEHFPPKLAAAILKHRRQVLDDLIRGLK